MARLTLLSDLELMYLQLLKILYIIKSSPLPGSAKHSTYSATHFTWSPIPPHTAHGPLFHHTLHMVPYSTTHCTWSPISPHTSHGPLFHHTLHMVPYSTTHCTLSPIPPHTTHCPLFHHTLHMVSYSTTHCGEL